MSTSDTMVRLATGSMRLAPAKLDAADVSRCELLRAGPDPSIRVMKGCPIVVRGL